MLVLKNPVVEDKKPLDLTPELIACPPLGTSWQKHSSRDMELRPVQWKDEMSPFNSQHDMTSYQNCVTFLPSNSRCKKKQKIKSLLTYHALTLTTILTNSVAWELLQTKADLLCHIHHPANFKSPATKEVLEDATIGWGFNSRLHGESIRIWECKAVAHRLCEGCQGLGIEGGAGRNVNAGLGKCEYSGDLVYHLVPQLDVVSQYRYPHTILL